MLDTNSIRISYSQQNCEFPAIVFGEKNYFVVWREYGNYGDSLYIGGSRVAIDGTVIDTPSLKITSQLTIIWESYEKPCIDIAFDGTNYLIAFSKYHSDPHALPDLYCIRVDQNGVPIDSHNIEISMSNSVSRPEIVFNGTKYLIVWTSGKYPIPAIYPTLDISGIHINTSGRVFYPFIISLEVNEQRFPNIASDGTNWLVMWYDNAWGEFWYENGLRGRIIDATGNVVRYIDYSQATLWLRPFPSITFGRDFLVVRPHGGKIIGIRINSNGGEFKIWEGELHYYSTKTSLTFNGENYLVAWVAQDDIYSALLDIEGNVLDTFVVCNDSGSQNSPAVASDRENYFIVWEDLQEGNNIYGIRVGSNGELLDSIKLYISQAPDTQSNPQIAFDGTNYLVVWQDKRCGIDFDIYGTLIDTLGNILNPEGIPICIPLGDQTDPALAFGERSYCVVWEDYRSNNSRIYGTWVSKNGTIGSTFFISDSATSPKISYKGDGKFLVVYTKKVGNLYNTTRVFGKFVNEIGIEESNKEIREFRIQCFPNPAFKYCKIYFSEAMKENVEIKIYDISGRVVRTLTKPFNSSFIIWNGKDNMGRRVNSGIYFIKIENSKFMQKIIFII